MLCSVPTGKSGSRWLDRLRSSKGIPTGDDLDLDSFLLSTANNHTQTLHQQRPTNPTRTPSPETHDPPIGTVLAELFNMGATLTQTYKKCPRKQTHPKFFLASNASNNRRTCIVRDAPATNSSDAVVVVAEEGEEGALDRGEDEDDGHDELKGFSRSEVTVIDTSCPRWKVDKFVFRKNSVWKVRERKPKSKPFAKKKSNGNLVPLGVDANGTETSNSKDNAVNMRGEKPLKMLKAI